MKLFSKYAGILTAFAMIVSVISANQGCGFHYGQTSAPSNLKKLRKF